METPAGCGTSLGLVWRFLTESARQMLPAEEVTVEGRRFSVLRQLGEGGFSFVHLAREIPDARGEDFALKRVLLHEAEHARAVEREMATMRLFDHPNILPLLLGDVEPLPPGASPGTTRRANLVFPVYPEGTLLDRALDRPIAEALTPVQLLSVTRQICLALRCMHEHPDGPVAHRDLKPGNVLLDADPAAEGGLRAVLMDFGSARPARVAVRDRRDALAAQESAAAECTAPFRAPELWDCPSTCDLDERVDVWSLGCVAYAAACGGRSPFESTAGETGGSLALAVLSGKYAWPESASRRYPREAKDLVPFCLEKDWRVRPTVAEVLVKVEEALAAVRGGGGRGEEEDGEGVAQVLVGSS